MKEKNHETPAALLAWCIVVFFTYKLKMRFRLWGSRKLQIGMRVPCVNFSLNKKK